jgi:hypothetical protein
VGLIALQAVTSALPTDFTNWERKKDGNTGAKMPERGHYRFVPKQSVRGHFYRDQMIRMAELWARLADRTEEKDQSHPAAAA